MRRVVDVQLVVVSCALLLVSACSVSSTSDDTGGPGNVGAVSQGLIFEQSLAITDQYTLEPFTFERVLKQIIVTSGASGVTPTSLFNQWWDTQNPGPGLGMGPHCDDEITNGQPSLNGYPWDCPRGEGYQAYVDPFANPRDPLYWPVGLFNRFDLAPADGSHCGEYRIAFAMKPGHRMAEGQNFIIFEAALPNPNPDQGIRGCHPVARFWYDLSHEPHADKRRALLEEFYFKGRDKFPPVVHVDHYGTGLGSDGYGCSSGQIRTNQFVGSDYWNLREFRMVNDCRCEETCGLIVAPTTTKNNPFADNFHGGSTDWRSSLLQSHVISSVPSLSAGSIHDISWNVEDLFNTGESVIREEGPTDYLFHFIDGAGADPTFANNLDAAASGFNLGSKEIVSRAMTQSCAGCHELTNGWDLGQHVKWPYSLGFFHVGDWPINGSFPLSDAMLNDFLPRRAELLMRYLESGGESPPTEGECKQKERIPEELIVNCDEERERQRREEEEQRQKREEEGREWTEEDVLLVKQRMVGLRPFHTEAIEMLAPPRLRSLGGSITH